MSVLEQLKILASKVGEMSDWIDQDSSCIKCNALMGLNEGAEWPDDPRLLLCGSCAIGMLGLALSELEAAKRQLEKLDGGVKTS